MEDKILFIKKMIDSASSALESAREALRALTGDGAPSDIYSPKVLSQFSSTETSEGKIIEGVFSGEKMIGPDGKEYPVPANYASKSKLVEGDHMKLTIGTDGKLTYKQTKRIPRKMVVGTLVKHDNQYGVMVDEKVYRVLLASVTYHHAALGNTVSIEIPEVQDASWGAIEAVIS